PPRPLARSGHARGLHSFPTRRSSDLSSPSFLGGLVGIGGWPLPLGASGNAAKIAAPSSAWASAAETMESFDSFFRRPASTRETTDRKSTRLNSSHVKISYAVFCLKKK